MTPAEVRRGLVDALRLDLVGPDGQSGTQGHKTSSTAESLHAIARHHAEIPIKRAAFPPYTFRRICSLSPKPEMRHRPCGGTGAGA